MNKEYRVIAEAAVQLAHRLPDPIMKAVSETILQCVERKQNPNRQQILQNLPTPDFREAVCDFLDRWFTSAAHVGSEAVATALLTAAESEHRHQQEETLEIVWTGPELTETRFRKTEQGILQVIQNARKRLTVISYPVYRIPHIREALTHAADRGVDIRLIVETPSRMEGQGEYDCLVSLGKNVASACSIYYWPQENRPKDPNGKIGILHVKCAVADGKHMFLSSANFTEYAFTIIMELGLLITGGRLPGRVDDHFQSLIETSVLVRI